MFLRLPRALSALLFRSFDAKGEFAEKIEQIQKEHPQKRFALVCFNAGLIEALALKLFLQKKFGKSFDINMGVGVPRFYFESPWEFILRIVAFFKIKKPALTRKYICSQEILEKRPVLINFWTGKKTLRLSTSPEAVLEDLKNTYPELTLIPLTFIWKRHAKILEPSKQDLGTQLWKTIKAPITLPWYYLLGDPYNPKGIRKIILMLRGYTRSSLRIAPLVETKEKTTQAIRRECFRLCQAEKKVVLGSNFKPPSAIAELVLRTQDFSEFTQKIAAQEKIPQKKVLKKAYSYFFEIAADYSFYLVEIASWILEKVFHSIYEGITLEQKELENLREIQKKGVIVLVPNHRSYIDFLVLPYILFREQFKPAHTIAGINLNFWPFGSIARMGGAFFIRRSFKGNLLYREVLFRYIATLLNSRVNLEFFIEGTRSRIGKLSPPRYGILNMINDAYLEGRIAENVQYVPVSITYDKVTEDRAHKRELEGGTKAKENFFNALSSSIQVLLKRFGKVHVRFADPISLKEWHEKTKLLPESTDNEKKLSTQKLAFQISHSINESTPLTATGLICLIFMAKPGNALSKKEVELWLHKIHKDIKKLSICLEPELSENFIRTSKRALARLLNEGVLNKYYRQDGGVSFKVEPKNRIVALYYRNTVIHAFLNPAIYGIAQNNKTDALMLRTLLEFEFFFEDKHTFLNNLSKISKADLCHRLYAQLLDETLENIFWGLNFLNTKKQMFADPKEWIQLLLKYGQEQVIEEQVSRKESINTHGFKSFISMAKTKKWLIPHDKHPQKLAVSSQIDYEKILELIKDFRGRLNSWDLVKKNHLQEEETIFF